MRTAVWSFGFLSSFAIGISSFFLPSFGLASPTRIGSADKSFAISGDDLRAGDGRLFVEFVSQPREARLHLRREAFLDHQFVRKPLMMNTRTGNGLLGA